MVCSGRKLLVSFSCKLRKSQPKSHTKWTSNCSPQVSTKKTLLTDIWYDTNLQKKSILLRWPIGPSLKRLAYPKSTRTQSLNFPFSYACQLTSAGWTFDVEWYKTKEGNFTFWYLNVQLRTIRRNSLEMQNFSALNKLLNPCHPVCKKKRFFNF